MGIAQLFSFLLYLSRRLTCLVRGHDLVMHFDRNLLALRCLSCGYRTHGWELDEQRPVQTTAPAHLPIPSTWRVKGPHAA
jgi:hypothetical protein